MAPCSDISVILYFFFTFMSVKSQNFNQGSFCSKSDISSVNFWYFLFITKSNECLYNLLSYRILAYFLFTHLLCIHHLKTVDAEDAAVYKFFQVILPLKAGFIGVCFTAARYMPSCHDDF